MSTPGGIDDLVTEDTPFVPEDDTYHDSLDDPYWVETNWWCWNIPERRIGCWLHAGYHTNRNQVTWRVFVWDPSGSDPGRLPYYANHPDVPMPEGADLRDITFPDGGFSVKMLKPLMDYQVTFADTDANFAIEMEHRSVHPPHRFTPGAWRVYTTMYFALSSTFLKRRFLWRAARSPSPRKSWPGSRRGAAAGGREEQLRTSPLPRVGGDAACSASMCSRSCWWRCGARRRCSGRRWKL